MKRTATEMRMGPVVRSAIAAIGGICLLAPVVAADAPTTPPPSNVNPDLPPPGIVRANTKASNQSDVSFPLPGVIKEIPVKLGDSVEAGKSLLAQQDDVAEKAQLATILGEIATAEQYVRAQVADLAKKKVDLGRQEKLYADLIAAKETNADLDEARVQVQIGEISIELYKSKQHEAELKRDEQQVRMALKQLMAPISGIVARVDLHPGEGTDPTKPAGISIVQNDPLWIEVQVPVKYDSLSVGQMVDVRYVDKSEWTKAKVAVLAPVASLGTNTRTVRLEMPNKDKRASGLQVLVRVGEENAGTGAAASGR